MTERILEKIPTPAAVESLLSQIKGDRFSSRTQLERQYKLSYLFGGMDVACRGTEDGRTEIVASGPSDEVAERLKALSDEEFASIYVERPARWETVRQIAARAGSVLAR